MWVNYMVEPGVKELMRKCLELGYMMRENNYSLDAAKKELEDTFIMAEKLEDE
jgi:hypothetical protein